jgi:hypothetical protein
MHSGGHVHCSGRFGPSSHFSSSATSECYPIFRNKERHISQTFSDSFINGRGEMSELNYRIKLMKEVKLFNFQLSDHPVPAYLLRRRIIEDDLLYDCFKRNPIHLYKHQNLLPDELDPFIANTLAHCIHKPNLFIHTAGRYNDQLILRDINYSTPLQTYKSNSKSRKGGLDPCFTLQAASPGEQIRQVECIGKY